MPEPVLGSWSSGALASYLRRNCSQAARKLCHFCDSELFPTTWLLIGEFHFGALDRGLFHTGLVSLPNQKARAQTYIAYVRGPLRHPQFVGCHWFQYFDEPTTGRSYDEENYQIGFVDIADTPYAETIAACREVGYSLYPNENAAGGK